MALNKQQQQLKVEYWWVPHDVDVWALASQSSPELPNGCVNFTLLQSGTMCTHQLTKCIRTTLDVKECPEDLVFLNDVNQASILGCIRERFFQNRIYTSIGAVLMAVNPFQVLPHLYGSKLIKQYSNVHEALPSPHVYQVAARAYTKMLSGGSNQSILISGESGAGKTEAAKQCLSYLTESTENQSKSLNSSKERISQIANIANRIVSASPILEAFGNAKTVRNPNSSRFGKWMTLDFDQHNIIYSSSIVSYLLEKGRVTSREAQERNYHIFYQILRGLDQVQLDEWQMQQDSVQYKYLEHGTGSEAVDLNDREKFLETRESFLQMGFDELEISVILKIVCAVLLIGNIEFTARQDIDGSAVLNLPVLQQAAGMLGVSTDSLSHSLTNRSIESKEGTRKNTIAISLNVQKACDNRDSLARQMYDKLFYEIISIINSKSKVLDASSHHHNHQSKTIGLLDIFGFEIFTENSFEQLCINYCNEILQNHFNFVIFMSEKSLYATEGIVCDSIEFRDNIEVIKEIEGLFKALDEEGRIPKGSSKTWYEKLKKEKKAYVTYPTRRSGMVFVVKHYAGEVTYNPLSFIEKNIETLSNDLVSCMFSSENELVKRIFVTPPSDPAPGSMTSPPKKKMSTSSMPSTPNGNPTDAMSDTGSALKSTTKKATSSSSSLTSKTISWRFTNQLSSLISMLRLTESHFIRCIKSNDQCVSHSFDSNLVHKQLIYSGVFEVVKIQQSGLPCRLLHRDWVDRYRCLVPSRIRYQLHTTSEMMKALSKAGFDLKSAQMGKCFTFMKSYEQSKLEATLAQTLYNSALKIQTIARKLNRRRIYSPLIGSFRSFYQSFHSVQLQEAEISHSGFNDLNSSFTRVVGYPVLFHVKSKMDADLKLLRARSMLVTDAIQSLSVRTEEGILALDNIIVRAIDLDFTTHPLISECKSLVRKYYQALEFIQLVSIPGSLYKLTVAQIDVGISDLAMFGDVQIAGAAEAISSAVGHKEAVDLELQTMVIPLQQLFQSSMVFYDSSTGNIELSNEHAERLMELRSLVEHCQGVEFCCADSHIIIEECMFLLRIIDEFLPCGDASGALSLICSSRLCSSRSNNADSLFSKQLEEFRRWADMQLSSVKLKRALAVGVIPMSAVGNEDPVEVAAIQEVLDKLTSLKNPSLALRDVIRAASWMVKLRSAFCKGNWTAVEEITQEADRDGVENCAFDHYPECIDELNNAQWQVIYNGLLNDTLYVLRDPVFSSTSMASESWIDVVADLPDTLTLVETIKEFADEDKSPILYSSISLLESWLQLRSLMFKKDLDYANILQQNLFKSHEKQISLLGIGDEISKELRQCSKLIRKVELEVDLNDALTLSQVPTYDYDGWNDQPEYNSLSDLASSIDDLRSVLNDLDALSDESFYHKELREKIKFARIVCNGRALVASKECRPGVDWERCLEDFEDSIAVAMGQSTSIPDYVVQEYEIMTGEFIRRNLLVGFNDVLCTTCVVGEVDINITVSEEVLKKVFSKYNSLALFMSQNFEEYPNNLQALSMFVVHVLKLRRNVFEGAWDSSIRVLLDQISVCNHGGGLSFEPLKVEIQKVRDELYAREAILALTNALEDVPINLPDDPEDTRNIVDLTRLRKATKDISGNKGKHSKQLFGLAETVIGILEEMLAGRSHAISPSKVDEAAAHYVTYHLNSDSIEKVFSFTRVHSFMRNLIDAISLDGSAEQVFAQVNSVKNNLLKMPHRFVPWLKAAYLYCDLASSLQSHDWIRVVESTRNLEESIHQLDRVKITTEGDAIDEGKFLDILYGKVSSGYASALKFKESAVGEELVDPVEISEKDSLKAKLREDDEKNLYGITQLRLAGFEESAILDVKFPLKYLWALDFDPIVLRKKGFTADNLLSAGYTATALYQAGFSCLQLKSVGCDVATLRNAGASLDQLRLAGFTDMEVLNGQLPENFLKSIEYDASKLVRMGLALKELVNAGFSAIELRAAGFTVPELRKAGLSSIAELRRAGFDLHHLKSGFDIFELKDAGYSFRDLQRCGFDEKSLLDAGFGPELDVYALLDLFETTNGRNWKVRLNWCTSRPLSCWFGVGVEVDMDRKERVVSLNLTDNHLSGTFPNKLHLLSKLKSLHLSMNFLTGQIPQPLFRLIRTNKINTDLQLDSTAPAFRTTNIFSSPSPPAGNKHEKSRLTASMSSTQDLLEDDYSISHVALMDMYHSMNGPRWVNHSNWGSDLPLGEWYGVTTNKSGIVVKLILPSNNLQGSIPSSICYLEYLCELDLRLNQLSGPIPDTLGNLSALRKMHLHHNRLSSDIPESIGSLTRLEVLDLRGNQLSGKVPTSLSSLRNLKYLGLRSNKFSNGLMEVQRSLAWCKVVS